MKLSKKMLELLEQARNLPEVAMFEDMMEVDTETLEHEDLVAYATMARLHRLADAKYEQIVADHVNNVNSVATADQMVDLCTREYIMDLSLSFIKLAQFAAEMSTAVKKHGITPPDTWTDIANGQFDYREELERVK